MHVSTYHHITLSIQIHPVPSIHPSAIGHRVKSCPGASECSESQRAALVVAASSTVIQVVDRDCARSSLK